MAADWKRRLERWLEAGLIDKEAAGRIVEFEQRAARTPRLRWPVALILGLGALLIGAGMLLFVSANWNGLSPLEQISLVAALVAGFHLGGAWFTSRFEALSTVLHALGTISLGAAIALTGQTFNLAEHWPSGILLWAVGAALAYNLLGDWPQLLLTAILAPWWLASEWLVRFERQAPDAALGFLLLVAISYLGALPAKRTTVELRALCVLGSVAVLPLGILAVVVPLEVHPSAPAGFATAAGWALALLLPLGVARALRGADAWPNAVAAGWLALLVLLTHQHWVLAVHAWCAVGAIGLTAWGVREMRGERINLGVAAFAITVLFFYFSRVMDKLGRSASLISLGILFLAGGWALEKGRRRLIAQIREGRA